MKSNFVELRLQQIDKDLERWRQAALPPRPLPSWLRSIWTALGMPATRLAETLGIVPLSVTRAEHSEADDRITLGTLRRMAEALGCELQYVLVPKTALSETLDARASELARTRMSSVTYSMAL